MDLGLERIIQREHIYLSRMTQGTLRTCLLKTRLFTEVQSVTKYLNLFFIFQGVTIVKKIVQPNNNVWVSARIRNVFFH